MQKANHKIVYYRKMQKKKEKQADPVSERILNHMMSQMQILSQKIPYLSTTYSGFAPATNARLSKTGTSFRPRSGSYISQNTTKTTLRMAKSVNRPKNNKIQTPLPHFNKIENFQSFKHCNIRELLRNKQQMLKSDEQCTMNNPFYKIQRKRPVHCAKLKIRTEAEVVNEQCALLDSANQSEVWIENDGALMAQDIQIPPEQEIKRDSGIREKSETKVYEEIKRYFEEKYGQHSAIKSSSRSEACIAHK